MRKVIYESVMAHLLNMYKMVDGMPRVLNSSEEKVLYKDAPSVINHVDLWNNNVEFIEQDEVWERPAVFIEFGKIEWKKNKEQCERYCDSTLILHVVTEWKGSASSNSVVREESLEAFDLLDDIHKLLEGLSGGDPIADGFKNMTLMESGTNHNHEELIENIEVYGYKGWTTILPR